MTFIVTRPLEVVLPRPEPKYNGQPLAIIDVFASLRRCHNLYIKLHFQPLMNPLDFSEDFTDSSHFADSYASGISGSILAQTHVLLFNCS